MKRPILHRLFSAFLALLVLTSSVGLAVQQHTCRSSGHSTAAVIFSTPHHGCPAPTAATHDTKAQVKAACCDFSAHFHKLDASASDVSWAKHLAPAFVAVLPGPALGWQPLGTARLLAQAPAWQASDSSPPPRGGRTLLAFVCTLVV
ncbi:HYC_CC_PP family protein [Hymenobacter persicinus]|uniref:DUF2946 domain-containing protein n=1 Tax=Hymenobacter persicinus TaxID=2025506 RepID=A0A4V1ZAQ9_9BACT|nr:hypothetical protein [Hymenobacter persicinus]RYU79403.1 hypothetical protein EWM57_10665 [Hymenobacter persicinus]